MTEEMMKIFFEIHSEIPREGPGNAESTRKAYAMLSGLPARPHILDVGCGPGMQTLELSDVTDGTIVAVDTHQPFLDQLRQQAAEKGVAENIEVRQCDMFSLIECFEEESFDLIWAEGSIYIIGFERGVREWKPLLTQNGYIAVTEISWLQPYIPKEVKRFWAEEYPAMQDIDTNLNLIEKAGYQPIGHFTLPESAWWESYYTPLEKRLALLREQYQEHEDALEFIETEQREIDLYRQYSAYYGYVFYLMQTITACPGSV